MDPNNIKNKIVRKMHFYFLHISKLHLIQQRNSLTSLHLFFPIISPSSFFWSTNQKLKMATMHEALKMLVLCRFRNQLARLEFTTPSIHICWFTNVFFLSPIKIVHVVISMCKRKWVPFLCPSFFCVVTSIFKSSLLS